MRGRAARRGSASRAGTLRDGRSGERDAPGGARGAGPRGAKGSTSAWGAPAPWEAPASGECAPAREKRCYFVCWLPGYGEAFIFSSLKYLPLCNLLGLQVGASRMKGHLDRSRWPVFMKLVDLLGLWPDCASAAFDNEWKKEGRVDWAELGKKIRDWAGQV